MNQPLNDNSEMDCRGDVAAPEPARILVVDDDPGVLRSIRRVLRGQGYDISTAADGAEAIRVLTETDVAVIVCDQRMPGMSGSEVLAESIQLRPDASRITITGYTELKAVLEAINSGKVDHFLLKPWDDQHLRATIREAACKHQMGREIKRLHELTRSQRDDLRRWNETLEAKVRDRTAALHRAYEETIDALVIALDTREHASAGHSRRVAGYALYLALRTDMDTSSLEKLYRGALLHDIGKIGIPDAILLKEGPLTDDERAVIQQHVVMGGQILDKISYLQPVISIPKFHHERCDGKGYSEGLTRDEIPFEARLFAIIDVYDALRTKRPYKEPMSHEKATAIVSADTGTHFDPEIVLLFQQISASEWAHVAEITNEPKPFHDIYSLLMRLNEDAISSQHKAA